MLNISTWLMYKSNSVFTLKKMEQLDGKSFVIKDVSLKKKKERKILLYVKIHEKFILCMLKSANELP